MSEEQVISWIFLAIAMASQIEPADYRGIIMIADGITHAVPNQKELQTSITWLTKNNLINKKGKRYNLTSKGQTEFEKASKKNMTLLKTWKNLEKIIINYE